MPGATPKTQWWRRSPLFWIAVLTYLGTQTVAMKVLTTAQLPDIWRFAIGLLPLLPLLVFAYGLLTILRAEDELHKRIQLEAIAWAAGTVVVLGFTLGFMEQFKVIEPINSTWAAQVLIIVWGVSAAVLTRRYG
jgi:hypothetical protein